MQTFTDTKDRKWTIEIVYGHFRKFKRLCDVDFLGMLQAQSKDVGSKVGEFMLDAETVINCIWIVVEGQHDIDDEEFGMSLGGDAVNDAYTAFFESIMDFFRKSRREPLAEAIAKQLEVIAAGMKKATDTIREMNSDDEINRRLNNSFGKTPVLPERTPMTIPGAS